MTLVELFLFFLPGKPPGGIFLNMVVLKTWKASRVI